MQNTSSSSVPLAPPASPAVVPPATVPGQSLPQLGTFGQVVPSFIPTYSTLSSPAVVSSLSPVPSSTFPPLSLGGSLGATTFSSTPPTLGSDFPVGPGYSPIPHKLVVKITGGQFIELADLLSDNIKAQDTQPQAYLEGKLLVEKKKRVVEITDIVTWVEAFSIFCLVLCNSFPSRWLDLHKYKLLIIQTAKRFRDRSWLNYDIAYRKEAAASGSTDGSRMNADLYNFHTRSPSASTSLPDPAPLLASPSSGAPAATGKSSATQYCHSWNDGVVAGPLAVAGFVMPANRAMETIEVPTAHTGPHAELGPAPPTSNRGAAATADSLSTAHLVNSPGLSPLINVRPLQLRSPRVPVSLHATTDSPSLANPVQSFDSSSLIYVGPSQLHSTRVLVSHHGTADPQSPANPVHSFDSSPSINICPLQWHSSPAPVSQHAGLQPVSSSSEDTTSTLPAACPLKPVSQLSPIVVDRLQYELRNYPHPDKAAYVIQGLRHGFHLGFNHKISLKSASGNMASAVANPQVIDNYLHTEVQLGRVAGPFLRPPLSRVFMSVALVPSPNTISQVNGALSWTCPAHRVTASMMELPARITPSST